MKFNQQIANGYLSLTNRHNSEEARKRRQKKAAQEDKKIKALFSAIEKNYQNVQYGNDYKFASASLEGVKIEFILKVGTNSRVLMIAVAKREDSTVTSDVLNCGYVGMSPNLTMDNVRVWRKKFEKQVHRL